ncbi:MAG: hypothetical protein GX093_11600 [Xanthomonadaceae bacterium]|nr:hypothetical protein [Xanthomonadaceae bacterium]
MKQLILMRHGHAAPARPGQSDFDRPLSPGGEREVAIVAERLAGLGWQPERIIASAAPRAQATAAILASYLGRPPLLLDQELYLAGSDVLRHALLRYGGDSRTIALIGHNPGMTQLVRELAQVGLDDLPTAGVAAIEFPGPDWEALGEGRLRHFDAPLLLR